MVEPAGEKTPSAGLPSGAGESLVSPSKRTKSRGVFVRSGRIYDSENGKTCHQCRQKTRDFSATCKNDCGGKQCHIHFCHTCLLNRYGEKAEDAVASDGWSCPKCRGICNCSFCMKKRGQQPTGILAPMARSTGFSSVSQMLQQGGCFAGWEAKKVVSLAGSAPEDPIDVDELLELDRRKAVERDREIEALKAEIAALQGKIQKVDTCKA